jgi:Fe-S cluster assembly scaffold protein SufB
MPADLSGITNAVTKATSIEASAQALIEGFAARLQSAVDAATANGATAEQLAPVSDLATALDTESDALQAAVSANTPAA